MSRWINNYNQPHITATKFHVGPVLYIYLPFRWVKVQAHLLNCEMEANRAAVLKSPRASVEVEQIETWAPAAGEVLVRNEAIAFNPIEAKIQK